MYTDVKSCPTCFVNEDTRCRTLREEEDCSGCLCLQKQTFLRKHTQEAGYGSWLWGEEMDGAGARRTACSSLYLYSFEFVTSIYFQTIANVTKGKKNDGFGS